MVTRFSSPFGLVLAAMILAPVAANARVEHTASGGDEALAAATQAWKSLDADHRRRDRRDLWAHVVDRLSRLGHDAATPKNRALAMLRASEAAENLANVSGSPHDFSKAALLYRKATEADDKDVAHEAAERETRLEERHPSAKPAEPEHVAIIKVQPAAPKEEAVAVAKAAPEPKSVTVTSEDGELAPDSLTDLIAVLGTKDAPPPPSKATTKEVAHLRASAMADTSVSLSEQAGLKVRRIIVDAGHGGHDTGAIGPSGVREKDVTLAIARNVAKELRTRGYTVVLTRDSDEFVALEERTAIANRAKGDLFVSVHANASPSHGQSGVETYSLNVASNRFAMRLSARENASVEGSVSDLQYLLADLATRANTVDSDRLAECVQGTLVDGVAHKYGRPKDNGVKHALFYVLLGTRMPAILVETQFVSNPREEKRLSNATYQEVVARGIAAGVDRFAARRQQFASAAP